ncbi:MAG TPA: COX15/CtaA family protein [Solirubrobacteraceae bacterium]|nr:COX15/CtaA family protein [Solirubrobacteraceae bacterium]
MSQTELACFARMSVATRSPGSSNRPRGSSKLGPARLRERARGLTLTPGQYTRVTQVALAALAVIVITGATVRLTGSGLGCPDWPKCYGRALPPLDTHAVIEYGNRVVSGLVGIVAVLASLLAWRRRPYRRDLALLGLLLPLGVVAQAVLGGILVRDQLKPTMVMVHFGLSMLILVAATILVWRAGHEPGAQTRMLGVRSTRQMWTVRGLVGLGAVTIVAGTVATAAGPHSGGTHGQVIERLNFKGASTLDWTIHRHGDLGALLGLGAVLLWWWLRRTGAGRDVRRAVGWVCVLLVAQGAVGLIQYYTELPAELVWVHVTLATLTWLALLWAAAAAGRPSARIAAQTTEAPVTRAGVRERLPA